MKLPRCEKKGRRELEGPIRRDMPIQRGERLIPVAASKAQLPINGQLFPYRNKGSVADPSIRDSRLVSQRGLRARPRLYGSNRIYSLVP
jgi:hypothetical protein